MTGVPRAFLAAVCTLSVALLFAGPAQGQDGTARNADSREERGSVTYVTSTVVYGDLGRRNGLREGDTVRVEGSKGEQSFLLVQHLSSRSFSAEVLERQGTILKGDAVIARVRAIVVPPAPRLAPDSAVTTRPPVAAARPAAIPGAATGTGEGNRIQGRLALQYHALHSEAASGLAFSQPAAVLRFTAEDLFDVPLHLSYYSNHRYDARSDAARTGVAEDRLRNRFYQVALRYGDEDAPLSGTVGRFIPYQVGGIGTVDGAMLQGRSGAFEGGVVAGSQPGYRDSELSLQDQKVAAYAGYASEAGEGRLRSNLAVAQTYRDGAADRAYLYLVNSYALGGTLSLYQNATADLYDADRGSGHTRPHLTDLFLSATWRPVRAVSLTGSFADRRSVYFLRSFASLPDSLFNTSRLQNYQLSAGFNIPGGMYATVTGSLRTQENADRPASALGARWTWADAASTGANLYIFGGYADNLYNTSRSLGLEVNRDLLEGLYSALRYQQYHYVYTVTDRAVDRHTVAAELYYRIGLSWYLSLHYERYWEGGFATDRLYSEISFRLR